MTMCTLIIDNYDSFTYNLFRLLRAAAPENERFEVQKNDAISPSSLLRYRHIVAPPGPGLPSEVGFLSKIFPVIEGKVPYLGVCLGHQALAKAYGVKLYQLPHPVYGGTSQVRVNDTSPLFKHLVQETTVTRYHSWAVGKESLPHCPKVVSETSDGVVMALQHRHVSLSGAQFHPESLMTPCGLQTLQNFHNL